MLAAVDGAWHITLLCQFLVCGVLSLVGEETSEDARTLRGTEGVRRVIPSPGGRRETKHPLPTLDLLVKALDAPQQAVDDLGKLPLRLVQSLG